jgi:hypothetical protein
MKVRIMGTEPERTPSDETWRAVRLWLRQAEIRDKIQTLRDEQAAIRTEWDELEESLGRLVPDLRDSLIVLQNSNSNSYLVRIEHDDCGPCVTVQPAQPSYMLAWPAELPTIPVGASVVVDTDAEFADLAAASLEEITHGDSLAGELIPQRVRS